MNPEDVDLEQLEHYVLNEVDSYRYEVSEPAPYGHLARGNQQHVRDRLDAYAQRAAAVRTRDRTSG